MTRGPTVRLQSGALPFRIGAKGRIDVLLVTTGPRGRWGIPKGKAEPELTLGENAAKEAYEEAGVIGEIAAYSSGMFRTMKRDGLGDGIVEVWVFLLKVAEILEDWPEKARRRTKWVRPKEAAKTLREPLLSRLCLELHRITR
jgi:8-oxo-dGTP pyrophosphatase MutT (NUDIX family)